MRKGHEGINRQGTGWLAAGLVLLAWLFHPALAAAQPRVVDLRLGEQGGDAVRIVLESDQSLAAQVSVLADPYRLVVDLPAVDWAIGSGEGRGLNAVDRYRYGLFAADQSRLVFDLKRPMLVKSQFSLAPNSKFSHRLVLDLVPASRAGFLDAARSKLPITHAVAAGPVIAAPSQRQGIPLIVIDPGHGGNDPGAPSVIGIPEKYLALAVAREVKRRLEASGQFRAVLTRDRDIFLPLNRRVAVARAEGADLFISIHADSIADANMRGGTVYTLSEKASDKEAGALAAKENKADIIAGVNLGGETEDVAGILIELAQRETMNYSARFAGTLIEHLGTERLIPRRPHRFAGFRVLTAPDVPSILIEMGYLSNRRDAEWINSSAGQRQIADAISRAAQRYFSDRLAQKF